MSVVLERRARPWAQRLGFVGPKKEGVKALARVKIGLFAEARVRGKTGAVASPVSEPCSNGLAQAQAWRRAVPQMRPCPPC